MKNILFIEDDPILGPLYESQLKNAGYAVNRATDGEAGLSALQSARPDLIMLDIVLPKISGVELLQMFRTTPEVQDIPVIVFTNSFKQEVIQQVERIGARRILTKSKFVPRDVLQIIDEVLNGNAGGATPQETAKAASEAEHHTLEMQLNALLSQCRKTMAEVSHETGNDFRVPRLRSLRTAVRQLTGCAAALDLKTHAYFSEALEALLADLTEQPDRITASSLRTISQSVDFLFEQFDPARAYSAGAETEFSVLIVDDDAISRRAIQASLGRIKQAGTECGTVWKAIDQAKSQGFDLIFLDVDMPEVKGDELCSTIRKTSGNAKTPVIFVTSHTDLQTRAKSTLSGGTDFIGKPFHFMELAVKSLLHVLRRRLH
ncbi:MAG TPA: hypothetical protein DCY13_16905 [Verrucomicrobiales bacterium]|nr:hypothetical protein [Verrucomicrobiales bacterium]